MELISKSEQVFDGKSEVEKMNIKHFATEQIEIRFHLQANRDGDFIKNIFDTGQSVEPGND